MKAATLELVNAALAAVLAIEAKAHVPGDDEEDHENNTFGLPDGAPLRRRLRRFFREQLQQVAGHVATIGEPLDRPLPRMAAWNEPMADAMTPIVGVYWDRVGKSLRGRIGLDPDGWRVTDPNVHAAIKGQCLTFCRATNATTDLGVAAARDAVRDQLARGLIGRGDTVDQLTNRVRSVFDRASKSRARAIAVTEASRAVHAASEMSARQSGVVSGKRWLLSANSCPTCVALAAAAGVVPLDGTFGRVGHSADYSDVRFPPAHPHCRCSITYELIEEPPHHPPDEAGRGAGSGGEGGRSSPSGLLAEFAGIGRGEPREGRSTGRRVLAFVSRNAVRAQVARRVVRPAIHAAAGRHRDRVEAAREAANPKPAPVPATPRIPPGPIADRIQAYMQGEGKAKLERLAALDDTYLRDRDGVDQAHREALKELDRLRRKKGYSAAETVAAEAKVKELADRKDAYADVTRRNPARVAEAIGVEPASRAILATRMVTPGRALPLLAREAESWLGRVLAGDPGHPKGIKVEYGKLRGIRERAYYSDKDRRINLSGQEPASTIVHEFGHAIEHQWPEVFARSCEFLDHRVGREKIRKLRDIFPRKGFEGHERGRKDRFDQAFDAAASDAWYVGKEYRDRVRDPKSRWGTEILSMGLEKLMTDPVKFAKKDPEFCAYILGTLDGSLR